MKTNFYITKTTVEALGKEVWDKFRETYENDGGKIDPEVGLYEGRHEYKLVAPSIGGLCWWHNIPTEEFEEMTFNEVLQYIKGTEIPKKIDVQMVFRKVINAGLYHGAHPRSREYMCHSLEQARFLNIIIDEEYDAANIEIQDCLRRSGTNKIAFGGMVAELARQGRHTSLHNSDHNYSNIFYNWNTKNPFPNEDQPKEVNVQNLLDQTTEIKYPIDYIIFDNNCKEVLDGEVRTARSKNELISQVFDVLNQCGSVNWTLRIVGRPLPIKMTPVIPGIC